MSIDNDISGRSELLRMLEVIHRYESVLPAAAWVLNPLWREANWSGTSYQFDRAGDSPPVMGLAFENDEKGCELFRAWTSQYGPHDELDEIRITVIEGGPGYFIHIAPDPENSMIRATAEGIVLDELPLKFLGQTQWMEPVDGTGMLARFRELYDRHGEFLFAPTTVRDGQRWVKLDCGIIKREIHFRKLEDFAVERTREIDDLFSQLREGVQHRE